jgi:DNA recombination protein RmuC
MEPYMIALFIVAGVVAGALIGYLIGDRRGRGESSQIRTDLALANQRQSDGANQLAAEKQAAQDLRNQLTQAQIGQASLTAQVEAAQLNLAEQRKLLDEARVALRDAFGNVSAEALARNNEEFLKLASLSFEQRKQQVDALLQPLKQTLDQMQTRSGDIEKARVESYSMLREQIGTLTESQRVLNTHTAQLVTALSRPDVRGQWGEISVRRLLELSGMTAHCDFVEQQTVAGENGPQRPDFVIKLPAEREVVIDCKSSGDAFLKAAKATDELVRRGELQKHAQQVRSRARELALKSYWAQFTRSPEYVVMFLPGEALLYAALEHDEKLLEDCLRDRVILAAPSTLMALLRVIEIGWREERAAENSEQIRQSGQDLYDRIRVWLEHMGKLGTSLKSSVVSYNAAMASLESRVIPKAREMGDLGAKSGKELPDTVEVDVMPRPIENLIP